MFQIIVIDMIGELIHRRRKRFSTGRDTLGLFGSCCSLVRSVILPLSHLRFLT